jgi:single-stranded-DNA-specific exonuclease
MTYKIREEIPKKVATELDGYSPIVKKLLFHRGITTKAEADRFMDPDWDRDSNDPFLMLNMEKAVDRILSAIKKEEKIVIYSDYDADGIPGGVVLHDFFKKIGYSNFSNYIPHRHDEGYGLKTDAIEIFAKDGVNLIITVDLGITDIEPIALINKLGMEVIVTDHHLPVILNDMQVLPAAYTVLDSKQAGDEYPDNMLCGAGVAFKLVQALLKKGKKQGLFQDIPDGWEKWLLDMAGLSTIADMVPLKKENRVLAKYGLTVMRKSKRVGLLALLRKMNISQKDLTEDDIGYMIVPRINAAGRMDHPMRAFELLATADPAEAEHLAEHLSHINDQRKGHVAVIIKEARKHLELRELREVIVVGHPEWMPGVLGLVANKLVEDFKRPVFVWGYDSAGKIKGSCRGNGTMSIVELMRAVPEGIFLDVGGHHEAGGFSTIHEHIHTLEETLSDLYMKMNIETGGVVKYIDSTLILDDVTWKTFKEIDALSPFGLENEKPIFLFENVEIDAMRIFGKTKEHLGLDFRDSNNKKVSAIGFFLTDKNFPDIKMGSGEKINLIASFERSTFRNITELRLRITDILPPSGNA